MKDSIKAALTGAVLAVFAAAVLFIHALTTENHRLRAELEVLVTDDPHAKGRYLAPVDRIDLSEVMSEEVMDSLAERWASVIVRADASVTAREVVYVEVPAERHDETRGFNPLHKRGDKGLQPLAPDFSGYWTADLPEAALSFRLPEEQFGLRLHPRTADLEIVLDDQYALHVASLDDWLLVGDVLGVTAIPRPSVWHVGGGAVWDGDWGLGVHGRVALDGWGIYAGADYVPEDDNQLRLRAGVELPLGE